MFGSLGFPELMLIFVVALIIFGPRRLPEIGKSIGKALGEFRRATTELKTTLEEEVRLEEQKDRKPVTAVADVPPAPVVNEAPTVPTSSSTENHA